VGATLELLSQPLRKARLDDKNRILYLNDTILIEGIPEAAFAYRNYPPLRWISEYLVPSTDEETGIRWEAF
jgi:predicted helicase